MWCHAAQSAGFAWCADAGARQLCLPSVFLISNSKQCLMRSHQQVIAKFKGSELKGRTYEPLFPYYAHLKEQGAFKVCSTVG